jgi:hypothetical protein
VIAAAAAIVAIATPALACPGPRTVRYDWRYGGHELDVDRWSSFGLGCEKGADCFTLVTRQGEHSITLDARAAGVPAYGYIETNDDGRRGWPTPFGDGFCGRTTISGLQPGDAVTVYFTVVQNPAPVPFDGACAQSPVGTLTVTYGR